MYAVMYAFCGVFRDRYLEKQQAEKIETEVKDVDRIQIFSSPLINEDLPHSGTEVVLVREGSRAGGGSSQRKKGSDYFTSPVKTMTLRDIKKTSICC
jgi:hypothetical protein